MSELEEKILQVIKAAQEGVPTSEYCILKPVLDDLYACVENINSFAYLFRKRLFSQ